MGSSHLRQMDTPFLSNTSANRSETSTAFGEKWNSAMRMPLTSLLIEVR